MAIVVSSSVDSVPFCRPMKVPNGVARVQRRFAVLFSWRRATAMPSRAYEMILTGDTWDTMIGGYRSRNGKPPHWLEATNTGPASWEGSA